jgi:AraC-like DNA-binding protein
VAAGPSRPRRPAGTGEPLLIPSGIEYTVDVHSADMRVVSLEPAFLHEAAGTPRDRQGKPVDFISLLPLDPTGAELWRATTTYVAGQLSRATALSPLAVSGMARLLATTTLAVFPNSTQSEPEPPHTHDATPDTVRRAVAYIESRADQDIGVTDIAAASGVTPRALQYAFRRHLGTTPLGHLRRVRLDLVHRDLVAAGPTSGATVTQLAGRWGFWHAGRFAAQYRAVYGCSPSETLYGGK